MKEIFKIWIKNVFYILTGTFMVLIILHPFIYSGVPLFWAQSSATGHYGHWLIFNISLLLYLQV